MNKKLFSLKMYIESLKQLKIIGIVSMIILCLDSILSPVSNAIGYKNSLSLGDDIKLPVRVTFDATGFLICLLFIVVVPVMMLTIFHYLTKRNASDFYHAIPQTRGCVFLSYFAGVVTWVFTILAVYVSTMLITLQINSKYFSVNYGLVFKSTVGLFAVCLLVASAIAVAISITGTLFSNITVTGIILFIPRIIILAVSSEVLSLLPFANDNSVIPFMDMKYNLLFNFFNDFLENGFNGETLVLGNGSTFYSGYYGSTEMKGYGLSGTCGIIYTLILAAILFILAYFMIKRRKSESAGNAAPNRAVQAVYRIAITMVVCIPGIIMIFDKIIGNESTMGSNIEIVTFYIIAFVVYFLYELISTKKIKNIIRAIPGLLIVIVMNLIIIGAMYGMYTITLNRTPDSNDIDYITLENVQFGYQNSYINTMCSEVKITDSEAKDIVASTLQSMVELYKSSPEAYYVSSSNSSNITVNISTGTYSCIRTIVMSTGEYNRLHEIISENEEIIAATKVLPDAESSDTIYYDGYITGFTSEEMINIYKAYREDVDSMDIKTWKNLLRNGTDNTQIGYISLSTLYNEKMINFSISISNDFPKAFKEYVKTVRNNNINDSGVDAIDRIINDSYDEIYLNLCLYDKEGKNIVQTSIDTMVETSIYKTTILDSFNEIKNLSQEDIDFDDYFVMLDGFSYGKLNYTNNEYLGVYKISKETFEQLKSVKTNNSYISK